MTVEFIQAPEIPGWIQEVYPFKRRIAMIDGLRMHFVDDGEGPVVLMLHGNPTWSFLWRKVITRLLPEGVRCVAPDLIGLGLSDKPTDPAAHTFEMHAGKLRALVEALDLRDITIVGQDWGGPIVTSLAARDPARVRAAVYANTAVLSPGKRIRATKFHRFSQRPAISEVAFRGFNFVVRMMPRIQGDPASIGRLEKRAYSWPLDSWSHRAAPLGLARMVATSPEHPSLALMEECDTWVRGFKGPAALVWGLKDPILGKSLRRLREALPHASVTETQAGHFCQEEIPDELARAILGVTK